MGNVNVREDLENSLDDSLPRSGPGVHTQSNVDRSLTEDSMGNTPPETPGTRRRSPLLFSPQVPLAPLQRISDTPVLDHSWMCDSNGPLELPPEKTIPILITWNYGGNDVSVEGSWDNWISRKVLHKSGKDHSVLLVLPSGVYHYRFIVDGEQKYIPDLPHVTDEIGRSNVLDVTDYVPENLDSVAHFEVPLSPVSSYSTSYPSEEEFAKEPPIVPQKLNLSILGSEFDEESSPKPQHVVLNHLYIEKGWSSQSLIALSLTHRFQSKYATVVLYKPLKKQK